MKSFVNFLAVIIVTMLCASAFAEKITAPLAATNVQIFNKYTGLGSTARYSVAYKVDRNSKKTAIFQAYSGNGTTTLATIPGTAVLQCGATSSGPWVTSKDLGASTAASATTSTLFTVDELCQWYRIGWTSTRPADGRPRSISAWLLYTE